MSCKQRWGRTMADLTLDAAQGKAWAAHAVLQALFCLLPEDREEAEYAPRQLISHAMSLVDEVAGFLTEIEDRERMAARKRGEVRHV